MSLFAVDDSITIFGRVESGVLQKKNHQVLFSDFYMHSIQDISILKWQLLLNFLITFNNKANNNILTFFSRF